MTIVFHAWDGQRSWAWTARPDIWPPGSRIMAWARPDWAGVATSGHYTRYWADQVTQSGQTSPGAAEAAILADLVTILDRQELGHDWRPAP